MIPRATYRLQLHGQFNFRDATALIPYLARLGISHVYCSPYFRAHPGSTHGYDIVDHNEFNPEIGSRTDFERFVKTLHAHGMGHIADFVPNHVGIGSDNAWWMDVLSNGPASPYANHFDIDWSAGRLMIPVLGESYGRALDRGELRLRRAGAARYEVSYHEHRFPIAAGDGAIAERVLQSGADGYADRLHELLERQHYRLAHWRMAADAINYRRFFDINALAALRMESPAVFDDTHRLLLELVRNGWVDGLRIDHLDGLYDPAGYLERLRAATACVHGAPFPIWIEKISAPFERLRDAWAVEGTTGYGFANQVNGLFVQSGARRRLHQTYEDFIGHGLSWEQVVYESKRTVLDDAFGGELRRLVQTLVELAAADRHTRDFTSSQLGAALREVIACFPVYRTYVAGRPGDQDRRYIDWAIALAKRRVSAVDEAVFEFLRQLLLLERPAATTRTAAMLDFVMRFQQLTAPATAKGVEDTAMYRFNRLAALNEVGGDPDRFGTRMAAFHAELRAQQVRRPLDLLATTTHDSKRSEDVRVRIDVLSEFPSLWRRTVNRWRRLHRSRKHMVDGQPAPGPNQEYLLYQTLLGSWPLEAMDAAALCAYRERIQAYMLKAVREAKLRTSWANVSAEYERALHQFIEAVLEDSDRNPFLADMLAVQQQLARHGLLNGLAQTLCKLTAPGVPDIYQGTELWDFSLVDPDNRRAVDFGRRAFALDQLESLGAPSAAAAASLVGTLEDGRAKLHLIRRVLAWRRDHDTLYLEGDYLPARVIGEHRRQVFAFYRHLRQGNGMRQAAGMRHGEPGGAGAKAPPSLAAVTIIPRLGARLNGGASVPPPAEVWGDTMVEIPKRLSAESWWNLLDGTGLRAVPSGPRCGILVRQAFAHFPVALLTNERA